MNSKKKKAMEVDLRNKNKDDKCVVCEFLKSIECSRNEFSKLGVREDPNGSLFLSGVTIGFPGFGQAYYFSLYWFKEALKAKGYKLVVAKGQFGSRKLRL